MITWLVQTLVSVTMLMALVMAIRGPVSRAFGARIGYALWALPAIRMILPPLPGHRQLFMPVMRLDPAAGVPPALGLVPADAAIDQLMLPPPVAEAPLAAAIDWPLAIVAVWAAGAALFFAWQLLRYGLFVGRALEGARLLSVEAGVEVLASPRVAGPVAAGLFRRRIFLPLDFLVRFSTHERRQALLHEGAHHDRRDILANLAALLVLAAHWWNPLAYVAYRAFRADQELACDATVLDGASQEDRYAYGSALVKAGGIRMPTAACALDNGTEIKRRLKMLTQGRGTIGRRAAGLLLAITAIGGGLVATASGSYAARVAATVVPPSPPAPPAPLVNPVPPQPVSPPAPIETRHRVVVVRTKDKDGKVVTTSRTSTAEEDRAVAAADRAAELASREADAAGRAAAEAGRRAGEAGRRAAELHTRRMMIVDHGDEVRASLEEARNGLVKRCADAGMPVKPGEQDWGALATCDRSVIIAALESARAEILSSRDLDQAERTRATASLDSTIARMKTERK